MRHPARRAATILPSIQSLALTAADFAKITAPVPIVHGTKDRGSPYGGASRLGTPPAPCPPGNLENASHAPASTSPKPFAMPSNLSSPERPAMQPMPNLQEQFGQIDIYLFDQLLRGRIQPGMRLLDAGCGAGRNLVYFLRQGYEVRGVDSDAGAVARTRRLAQSLAPALPASNFRVEAIEEMTFPDACAEIVLASAVLHFARSDEHFEAMLRALWRVLKPGGLLFSRLASSIGMEQRVQRVAGRRFRLPDGSERYLVDEPLLLRRTAELGGQLADPLKTTIVQNQRCMTTWVVWKGAAGPGFAGESACPA